jgi:hypothetical protein
MSKEQWVEAYEMVIEDKIDQFFVRNKRYPNAEEEASLEATITEDDIRGALSSRFHNEDDAYEF